MSTALTIIVTSAIATWCVNQVVLAFVQRQRRAADRDERGLPRSSPTPQFGGLGIAVGMTAGLCVACQLEGALPCLPMLCGILLLVLVGIADDLGFASISVRLVAQFTAAGIIVYYYGGLPQLPLPQPLDVSLNALAIPVAMLWLVGVTNIYNFLDGIDGFAALQGFVVGLGMAIWDNWSPMSAVALAVAGASLGFLLHNWHPAKIWMGNAGAPTLGFAIAALPFFLDFNLRAEAVVGLSLCLWFFLADGSLTIFRRLFRGERVWQRHHTHLYQRLVQSGVRQNHVVIAVISAATVLAILSVVVHQSCQSASLWLLLALAVGLFCGYQGWTAHRER